MNTLFSTYKNLVDKVYPVMTNNNFKKTGMLTPNEFVEAGDYLVKKYKNWKWHNISKSKQLSYLPKNKQMLLMTFININTRYNHFSRDIFLQFRTNFLF